MQTLPTRMLHLLNPLVPLFSKRVWPQVQVLLAGTILAPGKRTVTAALRAMGLENTKQFQRYHRVLNRAVRSGRGQVVCCWKPARQPPSTATDSWKRTNPRVRYSACYDAPQP